MHEKACEFVRDISTHPVELRLGLDVQGQVKPSQISTSQPKLLSLVRCRLSLNDKPHHRNHRFSKSPELAETTFTMTTIEEENEITASLRNLAQDNS